MDTNENSLDMLERLLHDEIKPHSTVGLPSEPQVMRTKRMGHRKAQSISYLDPSKQPSLLHVESNHKRNSSLSGLSDTSEFNIPSMFHQPYQLPNHPLSGHRRFHSVGGSDVNNANLTYQFPSNPLTPLEPSNLPFEQSFGSPLAYTFPQIHGGHQKTLSNLSGTSEMVSDFVVMNLEKDESIGHQRPMTRLHPLMQDSSYPNNNHFAYQEDLHSRYPDNSSSGYIAAISSDEIHFNEETGRNEEDYGNGLGNVYLNSDDYYQVVTTCMWEDCGQEMHTQEALVNHILQEHVGSGKPSYTCHWVGCTRGQKPFTKRHKIQNHIRIHTGERPFACPIADCGKRFSRQDGLNTHIKTHSSIKPFVCSFSNCGKAYFHSRSLRKHERTHFEAPSINHNFPAGHQDNSKFGVYGQNMYIPSFPQQGYAQQASIYEPNYVSTELNITHEGYGLTKTVPMSPAIKTDLDLHNTSVG